MGGARGIDFGGGNPSHQNSFPTPQLPRPLYTAGLSTLVALCCELFVEPLRPTKCPGRNDQTLLARRSLLPNPSTPLDEKLIVIYKFSKAEWTLLMIPMAVITRGGRRTDDGERRTVCRKSAVSDSQNRELWNSKLVGDANGLPLTLRIGCWGLNSSRPYGNENHCRREIWIGQFEDTPRGSTRESTNCQ